MTPTPATFDRPLQEPQALGLVPMVIEQSGRGERAYDIYSRLLKERVKLGLALGEVVRAHALAAKPEQVKALVQESAQTYEQPDAVVRWHYEKAERLNEFEALAVERNVVDWVLARARVEDAATTFAELMGPARG